MDKPLVTKSIMDQINNLFSLDNFFLLNPIFLYKISLFELSGTSHLIKFSNSCFDILICSFSRRGGCFVDWESQLVSIVLAFVCMCEKVLSSGSQEYVVNEHVGYKWLVDHTVCYMNDYL